MKRGAETEERGEGVREKKGGGERKERRERRGERGERERKGRDGERGRGVEGERRGGG